jgi:hypothetical protein
MSQLGRISGPILSSNLLRNGIDLAFETNLIYLDVFNGRIGIQTDAPSREVTVLGTTAVPDLLVDNSANLANLTVISNSISNPIASITIRPNQASNPIVNAPQINTANLQFHDNLIYNSTLNSDINLSPVSGGRTTINSNLFVYGALHATGDITWDGDITLGNESTDTISFVAEVASNVLPKTTLAYDLGSTDNRWLGVGLTEISITNGLSATNWSGGTINSGNIRFRTNEISNNIGANDVNISPSGTGLVKMNGTAYISGSNINNTTDSSLTIKQTGLGYAKFVGKNGVVFPVGTTAQQPDTPVTSETRYNSILGYMEVYNGTGWQPIGGGGGFLNESEATDIMELWAMILG